MAYNNLWPLIYLLSHDSCFVDSFSYKQKQGKENEMGGALFVLTISLVFSVITTGVSNSILLFEQNVNQQCNLPSRFWCSSEDIIKKCKVRIILN